MASFKFCANLNFLFTETGEGFLQKYRLAKNAGFKGVETGFPKGVHIDDIIQVKNETKLNHVLLNISCEGKSEEMQFGCASLPNATEQFKQNLSETINLAKLLNCNKIHIMAGKCLTTTKPTKEYHETYFQNLKYAANLLETHGIIGVIEPINKYALPGYYLNNYETAINVLNQVNSSNLKLMIDIYHLQHIQGNITYSLKELSPYIGHIQIAQVPHRHEPNIPGELDFRYVFKAIEENTNYSGWIGLEYKPKSDTVSGLNWIKEFGYSL